MIPFRDYILGGHATFTIVSRNTGTRFTYRVQQKPDTNPPLYFVSVLGSRYEFLGIISHDGRYRHGRKSDYDATTPCSQAFGYLMRHVDHLDTVPIDFYPSTKCCRCGKTLTNPTSIDLGIGPDCGEGYAPDRSTADAVGTPT